MPASGRITVVSDFSPNDLLAIAQEVADDSGCGTNELGGLRRGFAIRSVKLDPALYTPIALVRMATDTMRAQMDIEVFVDRNKAGDGRLTIDWVENRNAIQPRMVETFAESLADEIEDRIEDDGGEVLSSDSD